MVLRRMEIRFRVSNTADIDDKRVRVGIRAHLYVASACSDLVVL